MGPRNDALEAENDWPMPRWLIGIWLFLIAAGWWGGTFAALSAVAGPTAMGNVAVPLAVAARLLGFAVEAGFYVAVWASLGRRLRFWWFYAWVATLSMLDLTADPLRRLALEHRDAAPWLAPFVGLGVIEGAFARWPGLGTAFGAFGLLVATRIVVTALLQARAVGVAAWKAVALTAGTWAVTRLFAWWSMDLMRGMSPMP